MACLVCFFFKLKKKLTQYEGFDTLGPFDYFMKIKTSLQVQGAKVEVTCVSPTTSISSRAGQLCDQIAKIHEKYNSKVHLISHRYFIILDKHLLYPLSQDPFCNHVLFSMGMHYLDYLQLIILQQVDLILDI